jgi:hypothetical protein
MFGGFACTVQAKWPIARKVRIGREKRGSNAND